MSIHVTECYRKLTTISILYFKNSSTRYETTRPPSHCLPTVSEQEAGELSEVVRLPVRGPGVGVEVDRHPVPLRQLRYHHLAGHRVGVVVVVVLVVDARQLLSVPSDGKKNLLLVLRADRNGEEVVAGQGDSEHTGPWKLIKFQFQFDFLFNFNLLCIQNIVHVDRAAREPEIFLTFPLVILVLLG